MERYGHVFLLFSSLYFYFSLVGAKNQSFNPASSALCRRPGFTCEASRVIRISRPGVGLSDTSFLTNISDLESLQYLNLSSNSLTGVFPNFSTFPALVSLDLSYNQLEGPVDYQLNRSTGLKILNLSYNRLTGSIPSLSSHSVEELVLSNNYFHGRIPDKIFRFENLTILDLSANSLSGSISDEIGNLSKLRSVLLSSNSLSGRLPSALSNITTLSRFAANLNNCSGTIPVGITRHVRVLDLSYNKLSGEIPSDFFSSHTLESIDLSSNHLNGSILVNLSERLGRLYRLRLGGNSLTGSIPPSIGNLTSLTYLELNDNSLAGDIPPELERCKNLTLLNLATNKLGGGIPEELGNLTQLVVLKLQMNNLIREIPQRLFELTNLSTLNLSRNSLTGKIPPVSGLPKISILNLETNMFVGSIPESISGLPLLIELVLGDNELNGTVPEMPMSLKTTLNLSSNRLSGVIPSSLGKLDGLEILDLSKNEFTGQVPQSLAQMQSLTQLVLSNNQLSGVLPKFGRYVNVTATGNKDLDLSRCSPIITSHRKKKSAHLIIVVVIASAFAGSGLVVLILVLASKRLYRVEDVASQSDENPPRITKGCFLTTNSIHISSIDFTKSMEAVGNPGNIMLKTKFSTYYKVAMPGGVCYSVKKLNWSEKIFQTGNRGRFGRELEILGRLSTSNVMVPLAYVLTEDTAYLFYEHVHKGTVFDFLHKGSESTLDWASRYSIALGVAQGLAFLHGCSQPVLLLDLTTKSIHLKSQKEPQIGDIELCKAIDPSKSTGSVSMIAGSVGYIPPEYAYTMRVTMAGNVYSFGVILLELLTGKPPVTEGIELVKWAIGRSSTVDERDQVLDHKISKTSPTVSSQMLSVLKVALDCVNLSPGARPKMQNVLRKLFNAK